MKNRRIHNLLVIGLCAVVICPMKILSSYSENSYQDGRSNPQLESDYDRGRNDGRHEVLHNAGFQEEFQEGLQEGRKEAHLQQRTEEGYGEGLNSKPKKRQGRYSREVVIEGQHDFSLLKQHVLGATIAGGTEYLFSHFGKENFKLLIESVKDSKDLQAFSASCHSLDLLYFHKIFNKVLQKKILIEKVKTVYQLHDKFKPFAYSLRHKNSLFKNAAKDVAGETLSGVVLRVCCKKFVPNFAKDGFNKLPQELQAFIRLATIRCLWHGSQYCWDQHQKQSHK